MYDYYQPDNYLPHIRQLCCHCDMYDITAKSPDNVSYIFSTPRFLVTFVGYWAALICRASPTVSALDSTGFAIYLGGGMLHKTCDWTLNPSGIRRHTERQPLISYDQSSETNEELTASVPILETENSFWIQRNKHFHWEANTTNKMQLEKNRLWTEEVQINEGRRKKN